MSYGFRHAARRDRTGLVTSEQSLRQGSRAGMLGTHQISVDHRIAIRKFYFSTFPIHSLSHLST